MKTKLVMTAIKEFNSSVLYFILLVGTIDGVAQGFSLSSKRADKFDKAVMEAMDGTGVPGMSLAIIDNNRVAYYNGYGVRGRKSGERVDKETVFSGCSLSKSFLVFVAYQLVDEGKLDLDKPMYEYVEHKSLQYDERYKLITARMVLSHSSGLENWAEYNNMDTLEILSNPGEKYRYSGEGYQYLSRVIEKILDKPYEQFIRERILQPLNLTHTYLKYETVDGKETPSNYAIGHEAFGETTTFKNSKTSPASGNHFTAEDYANLILGIFNTKYISKARHKDILTPMVKVHNSALYYGPGFEVYFTGNDTIIAHGGDNSGYKNIMLYSVVKKKGFVFLANSDRGKLMTQKLNDLSVRLDISTFIDALYYHQEQYPSTTLSLMKTFDEKGLESMLVQYEELKAKKKLSMHTLTSLSNFLRYGGGDKQVAVEMLTYNVQMHPNSAIAHSLLGDLYLDLSEYTLSLKHLTTAKTLKFDLWEIDDDIMKCKKAIAEAERRLTFVAVVNADGESTVEAENYNLMRGVVVLSTKDGEGMPKKLGYIDTGDWMEYKLDILRGGIFEVTVRVASAADGGSQIHVYSGTSLLTTIDVPTTGGWGKFTNLTSIISLPAGTQSLRLHASKGDFHINWFKFLPAVSGKN